jgi:radical SAM superfamily enzyme YgiQ (UPF0313 family)
MKIVLISTDDSEKGLGVKVLSSYLISQGHDTAVVIMPTTQKNYKNFYWNDLKKICKNAGLIGVSCMSHGVNKAIEIQEELKKDISAPIIVGGIHACLDPVSLIKSFVLICHGEGEDLIVELANRLHNNQRYRDIPGLWVKEGGSVIKNQSKPLKHNLNDYPLPDYDLSRQFILENNRLVPMKCILSHLALESFVITGSRGCNQQCAYCCNQKISDNFPWRAKVRHYSIDYFINHFKEVCKFYPTVKSFWIGDDNFFDKELGYIKEFCARYKNEVNKPFLILINPHTFNEDKLKFLIAAGMQRVIMGIQSGSERVNREIYNRNFPISNIIEVAHRLHKYSNLEICYDFIIMNPFEEEEDLIDTIQLIKGLPPPFSIFNNKLAFYPGSALFMKAHDLGLDVSRRIKHAGPDIGYRILKEEDIQHKLFHFILLRMCGKVNRWRVGLMPRCLLSNNFITFYSFLNQRLTFFSNMLVTMVNSLLFSRVRLKLK